MIGLAALALLLVFVSVAVHAVAVAHMMMRLVDSARLRVLNVLRSHVLLLFLVFTVLLASHLLQALLWASAYYLVGGFDDLATSLYFSLSSYTTVGYADVVLPVNSWVEIQDYECGASCSNPFLQVWKGGIKPVHDTIDDGMVFAKVADALTRKTGDRRYSRRGLFLFRSAGLFARYARAAIVSAAGGAAPPFAGRLGAARPPVDA